MTRLAEALAALPAGRHVRIKLGAGDFKVLGGPRRKPKHIEVLGGPFYGTGYYGGGGLGLIVVIVLILVLLGKL